MKYIINESAHEALAVLIGKSVERHLDISTWICGVEVKPSNSLDNPELKFEVTIYLSKDEFGPLPSNVRVDMHLSIRNLAKTFITKWFPFKEHEISVETKVIDC